MPFTGDTFTHLFDWEKDPQRQEKIVNSRLEAEFDGVGAGLSSLSSRVATLEGGGGSRELLTAPRTYYVRTDGSDSNDGLANSAGGAFLTIQKAINVIAETLDIGAQNITVLVGNGTYTGAVTLRNVVGFGGAGNLVIQGNTTTPSSCVISTTSATCFFASGLHVIWDLKGFTVRTNTSGVGVRADGSYIRLFNFNFGTCAGQHIIGFKGGAIDIMTNYTISGSATGASHYLMRYGSVLNNVGFTATVTGTPSFSTFAQADYSSAIECTLSSFSGSATGSRYSVSTNGVIQTGGGGASFFPGNAGGSSGTGGQYL